MMPPDDMGANVSDRLVDRMDEMTHFPRRCPHGEPIPRRDGSMPRVVDYPLNDAAINTDYVLSRANTHDEEKLQYLGELGLKPGADFRLTGRAPFNGPLQISINGETTFLGYELAGALRVCSREEFERV